MFQLCLEIHVIERLNSSRTAIALLDKLRMYNVSAARMNSKRTRPPGFPAGLSEEKQLLGSTVCRLYRCRPSIPSTTPPRGSEP